MVVMLKWYALMMVAAIEQIEFATDTLTPEDLKVFPAWGKNA